MNSRLTRHHDIAGRFSDVASQDALFARLETEFHRLGFERYIYAQMHVDPSGKRSAYASRSTTDPSMRAIYQRERVFEADPLVDHCIDAPTIALWSRLLDTRNLRDMPKRYRRMTELAESFGLKGGLCFRLEDRPSGAGRLVTGFAVMAQTGTSAVEHDRRAPSVLDELGQVLAQFRVSLNPGEVARDFTQLSDRELEVLRLTADGLQIQQVADQLYLADRTAAHHLGAARRKLGARTNAQAVAIAVRTGIL